MRVYNLTNIIPTGTVMNTTLTSSPLQLLNMFGYAIQVEFSGTPTGTFKLQASCDQSNPGVPNQTTPLDWTDIAGSSATVAASGDITWNATETMYNWVRLVYTDTSGGTSTATITDATFNGKGV